MMRYAAKLPKELFMGNKHMIWMKIGLALIFICSIWVLYSFCMKPKNVALHKLQDGDIVFHTSLSSQSKVISLATHSEYTHCGIVFIKNGKQFVLEAVQPVKLTPIERWIERGEKGQFVAKRLIHAKTLLTEDVKAKMLRIGKGFLNKDYDFVFGWSDRKIYCSELVWKIYNRALGVELGDTQLLGQFDLRHPLVQKKLKERYGRDIPLNEKVISPSQLFESELLETIH